MVTEETIIYRSVMKNPVLGLICHFRSFGPCWGLKKAVAPLIPIWSETSRPNQKVDSLGVPFLTLDPPLNFATSKILNSLQHLRCQFPFAYITKVEFENLHLLIQVKFAVQNIILPTKDKFHIPKLIVIMYIKFSSNHS